MSWLILTCPQKVTSNLRFLACTTANVGSSSRPTKSISLAVPDALRYHCPTIVDKSIWLAADHTFDDTFYVTHTEDWITVRRIDVKSGWAQDLRFECCLGGKISRLN